MDVIFGSNIWCNNWQQHRAGEGEETRSHGNGHKDRRNFNRKGKLNGIPRKFKEKKDELEISEMDDCRQTNLNIWKNLFLTL